MKHALHQGGSNALNLYSTTAGAYLGWAYSPNITTKPGREYLDGVVFDWETIPGTTTKYAGRYDHWITRTTSATRSSRRGRCSGCATPGCSTARPRRRGRPRARASSVAVPAPGTLGDTIGETGDGDGYGD